MHHDCVVVPGLGAFMINHESARYDSDSQTFLPPSRTLGFNPEVRHNDALLAGSISRRDGITLEAARVALDSVVASLLGQLNVCGEVVLGRLGTLKPGMSADTPVFEPSASSLPVCALSGLQPLSVAPLFADDEAEDRVATDSDRSPVVIPFPLKIVASIIAVMVGLGILYSTTSLVNSPRMNFASLDTGIGTHIERVIDSTVSVSREILLNIALPPLSSANRSSRPASEPVAVTTSAPSRYILVVGSFPTQIAAERHIALTGDNSLRIIEMDGNYRVYAASAPRIDDARSLAVELSERYPTVWVCRR